MAEEPDRIRNDIESTRAELTRNVDLLAEKTSPGRVARRQWGNVKEKVMGTPRQAAYSATGDAVHKVKERFVRQRRQELAPGGLMLGRAQMLERVDIRRGRELLDLIKESTAAIGDARIANRECRKQLARGRASAGSTVVRHNRAGHARALRALIGPTRHCTSRGDGAVRIDNRNRIHKPVAAEAIAPQGVALNLNLTGFVITAE